ncbi:hypothetical protein F4553_001650 [Allocatelliglobosispora scoriae]|uniref:Uncharacterized protein n=1 Tax=Allocatelliglobosispora scoriae TaxID=643052 RepID=A0A841BN60_9ACTN|nr:hypothetical protein [Allocatelliglobosispora scoriae]MBB5868271.1 hypothetical protein [Allocatelliglobosispora scoriae]
MSESFQESRQPVPAEPFHGLRQPVPVPRPLLERHAGKFVAVLAVIAAVFILLSAALGLFGSDESAKQGEAADALNERVSRLEEDNAALRRENERLTVPAPDSPTSSAPDSPAASASPSPIRSAASVRWQGTLRITGSGMDLDSVPPRSGSSGGDIRQSFYGTALITNPGTEAALWESDAVPTRDQCALLTSTQALGGSTVAEEPRAGMTFCFFTRGNRSSFLKIVKLTDDGFMADVIVWQKA